MHRESVCLVAYLVPNYGATDRVSLFGNKREGEAILVPAIGIGHDALKLNQIAN